MNGMSISKQHSAKDIFEKHYCAKVDSYLVLIVKYVVWELCFKSKHLIVRHFYIYREYLFLPRRIKQMLFVNEEPIDPCIQQYIYLSGLITLMIIFLTSNVNQDRSGSSLLGCIK